MNTEQLRDGLLKAFNGGAERLVFWYDPTGDFKEEVDHLAIPNVRVLHMAAESALAVKIRLEREDPEGLYLLYFQSAEPEAADDWLLDIKLYSRCFYADRISIVFNDLGLTRQSLKEHLALRQRFWSNKARIVALKKRLPANPSESDIDLAMMAVVLRSDNSDVAHLLFALAQELAEHDLGLETNPPSFGELQKYGLIRAFTAGLQTAAGYPATHEELVGNESLNLGQFLIRLLTTGFCESVGEVPSWATDIVMPNPAIRPTVRALLSRWRDSSRYYQSFDVISCWVAAALRVEQKLDEFELEALAPVETFECVEPKLIATIANAISGAESHTLAVYSSVIAQRMDGYWASRHKDDDNRKKYRVIYDALESAIELHQLRNAYSDGFHYNSMQALYESYQDELYQFDSAYRRYTYSSRRSHVDIIKGLDDAVEQCYAHWYIDNLAKAWGDKLEAENKLGDWQISGVPSQQRFFEDNIEPLIDGSQRRVVVIVSDALRYEAAAELKERINEKRYSEAKLGSQLGVVPSYTTLGMASLLPHSHLEYREGVDDDVFVDGLSSKGTTNRHKILAAHGGMAITADTLRQWSREEGREALKNTYLLYVYHNIVDAVGDSASTESDTFQAVEQAIEDLTELTRKLILINTSTVVITADHGFLFQQGKVEQADRTSLAEKPENAFRSKKRYALGNDLPEPKDAWFGTTRVTAGTDSKTQFWIPKGANRFHFVGGARFVHGGAMPQEVVVPVVTINHLRGVRASSRTKQKVGVISTKAPLKMVNTIHRFDLMQTEVVSEHHLAVTIAVAIYDNDKRVSSEETVTFESDSDSMSERVKQVSLSLSGSRFDRAEDYFLILRDKDLGTEIERYKVTIDLAFTDDFF